MSHKPHPRLRLSSVATVTAHGARLSSAPSDPNPFPVRPSPAPASPLPPGSSGAVRPAPPPSPTSASTLVGPPPFGTPERSPSQRPCTALPWSALAVSWPLLPGPGRGVPADGEDFASGSSDAVWRSPLCSLACSLCMLPAPLLSSSAIRPPDGAGTAREPLDSALPPSSGPHALSPQVPAAGPAPDAPVSPARTLGAAATACCSTPCPAVAECNRLPCRSAACGCKAAPVASFVVFASSCVVSAPGSGPSALSAVLGAAASGATHGVNGGALAESLLSCGGSVVASSAGIAAVFSPDASCFLGPAPEAFFLRPARTGRQHYAPVCSCDCLEHQSRVAVQASYSVPKIQRAVEGAPTGHPDVPPWHTLTPGPSALMAQQAAKSKKELRTPCQNAARWHVQKRHLHIAANSPKLESTA